MPRRCSALTDGTRLISFTGLGGEVTARLREDILSGRYKDGEHLSEPAWRSSCDTDA